MCGPRTHGFGITGQLVRIVDSRGPPQTLPKQNLHFNNIPWEINVLIRNPLSHEASDLDSRPVPQLTTLSGMSSLHQFGQNHAVCVYSFDLLISLIAKESCLSFYIHLLPNQFKVIFSWTKMDSHLGWEHNSYLPKREISDLYSYYRGYSL